MAHASKSLKTTNRVCDYPKKTNPAVSQKQKLCRNHYKQYKVINNFFYMIYNAKKKVRHKLHQILSIVSQLG
jgi:hypothetical protein